MVDVVLLAVQLNDDVGILFGNLDLDGFSCKFILDLHDVSFPLEAAPDGRDTKRAECHDGHTGRQHLQEGMTKHGGNIEFKKLVAFFGSLCIPPPLMRISRL